MIIKNDGPFLLINGILAGQSNKAPSIFTKFIIENNFDLIIEIGTGRGGFTDFLASHKVRTISYDIESDRNLSNLPLDFRIGDCLSSDIINEIKKEIEGANKVLFLCDGGSKEKEMEIYSTFLKSGSHIMCHDYSDDLIEYNGYAAQIGWPSPPESFYDNIKHFIYDNGFNKSNEYDMFCSIFWGSFVKK